MQHFTSLLDADNPHTLLNDALAYKKNPLKDKNLGTDKTIVLLFFNPSLRTRLSTQKAAFNLGMKAISMNAALGWNLEFEENVVMDTDKAEHIKEAAAVISQYGDVIGVRTFPGLVDREKDYQDYVLQKFIEYAQVPVISLESAIRHPLQSLADWLTIETLKKTERPKVVLSWAPHPKSLPQAVANSFVEWMDFADVDLVVTHPKGYELAPEFAKGIQVEYNQEKAFKGADFVYGKNWSSYEDYGKILSVKENWTITEEKMKLTNQALFMHCLPVRRNVVVTDEVLDGPRSVVIQQAENRVYSAMAVLKGLTLGAER